MAFPFAGSDPYTAGSSHHVSGVHDLFHPRINMHVAGFLVLAVGIVVAMQMAGFRAMVAVGRQ